MWLEVDFFNKDLTIFLFLIIAGCGIGHTPFDGKGQQRVGMGKPQPEAIEGPTGVQLRRVHQPEGGGSEAEACRCVEAGEEHQLGQWGRDQGGAERGRDCDRVREIGGSTR